jgi:hypothetical protein
MAVNELRETFHHWVRTAVLPVRQGALGDPLAYSGPHCGPAAGIEYPGGAQAARDLWDDVDDDVRHWLTDHRTQLTDTLTRELKSAGDEAAAHEKEAFERRITEVSNLQRNQSIEKLKREIEEKRSAALQYSLLEDADERAARELRDLQDELKRRQGQFGDLLERLKQEKERILQYVVPNRFTLRSSAQVFPVTIEIRLPEALA